MNKMRFLISLTIMVLLAGLGGVQSPCAAADGTPRVDKLIPASGSAGATVFLRGSGFVKDRTREKVYFGSQEARILISSESSIAVEVPQGKESCEVSVEVDGKRSNGIVFTYGSPGDTGTGGASPARVSLTVSDPLADVGKTISGTFHVTGTREVVKIHFTNASPDIVSLEGGNEQTVLTQGGEENNYTFPIHALKGPRHYTISYSWKLAGEDSKTTLITPKPVKKEAAKQLWDNIDLSVKEAAKTTKGK